MIYSSPWSLSELQLLNEELLAAVRSGVSLELGLRDSAQHLPGRLSQLADQLAQNLADGKSLPEALETLTPPAPVVYRVMVAAGVRGQQLEAVLVRLNEHARVVSELRESLRRAAIYPIVLGVVAFLLTCFATYFCVPPLRSFVSDMKIEPTLPIRMVYALHDTMPYWSIGIPLLVGVNCLASLAIDYGQSGSSGAIGFLRFIPGFGGLMRNAELSRLAGLLALQTEYDLPLPESLRRAGDSVTSPLLREFCSEAANRVERGESFGDSLTHSRVVPPFMKWMLSVPSNQQGLIFSTTQAAEVYRERTILQAEWMERMIPVIMTLGFGTLVVGLFCWAVFGSLVTIWNGTFS